MIRTRDAGRMAIIEAHPMLSRSGVAAHSWHPHQFVDSRNAFARPDLSLAVSFRLSAGSGGSR